MRKITVSTEVTLDGLIAGPNQEMDWVVPGVQETQPDLDEFLRSVDTMLLGRVAYEGLSAYWPDKTDAFGEWMNRTPKIILSRSPRKVEWGKWENIRLIHGNVAEEI